MTRLPMATTATPRIDPNELFRKLGLHHADERPILEAFRQANARWRIEHRLRAEAHIQRVRDHLRRFRRPVMELTSSPKSRQGKRRAVWCVELGRRFRSITAAARFANRKPSNISRALGSGGKSGTYHWESYDRKRHREYRRFG